MWAASTYLASGDLAEKKMAASRKDNRTDIPDDSLRHVHEPKRKKSPLLKKESDELPF